MTLRYDMGNAGDLLKHGILSEFVRWQCEQVSLFRFIDLFGGEPWGQAVDKVKRRVTKLPECLAFKAGQPDIDKGRYYGSGHLVRNVANHFGAGCVRVLTDDTCPEQNRNLHDSGLSNLAELSLSSVDPGPYDAYNAFKEIVLNDKLKERDLVLIDPYSEFLPQKASTIVPLVEKATNRATVILFALNLKPSNHVGKKFDKLLNKHLPGTWRMTCPPLCGTKVRGESKYHADVVLAAPSLNSETGLGLKKRLEKLVKYLATTLVLSTKQFKFQVIDSA